MTDNIAQQAVNTFWHDENVVNGGATIDQKGQPVLPKSGYIVSVTDHQIGGRTFFNHWYMVRLAAKLLKQAANISPAAFLGSWWDETTKKWCVDVSLNVDTLGEALRLARAYDQRAIYDCRKQRTINVH